MITRNEIDLINIIYVHMYVQNIHTADFLKSGHFIFTDDSFLACYCRIITPFNCLLLYNCNLSIVWVFEHSNIRNWKLKNVWMLKLHNRLCPSTYRHLVQTCTRITVNNISVLYSALHCEHEHKKFAWYVYAKTWGPHAQGVRVYTAGKSWVYIIIM